MNDLMDSVSDHISGICSTQITQGERCVSLAAGTVLLGWVISRASVPRMLLAAAGGYLIYRGATGRCPISEQLGCARPTESRGPFERQERAFGASDDSEDAFDGGESRRRSINLPEPADALPPNDADMSHRRDIVDEASQESFPASDPPAYSSATAGPASRPEDAGEPRKDV